MHRCSPEIASTLITAPTEFYLRWGTVAAATRDLEKMRKAVRHSMDSELFPSDGSKPVKSMSAFIAMTSRARTLSSYICPRTWMLTASSS